MNSVDCSSSRWETRVCGWRNFTWLQCWESLGCDAAVNMGWGCSRIGYCMWYLELRGTELHDTRGNLRNEALHYLYSSPVIVWVIKASDGWIVWNAWRSNAYGALAWKRERKIPLRRSKIRWEYNINPLNTKRRLLYLKTQFVPRSKHFSSLL